MSHTSPSSSSGFRVPGPVICILATLGGLLLPIVVGGLLDQTSHAEGGLNALFSVMGLFAGLVLGPLCLVVSILYVAKRSPRQPSVAAGPTEASAESAWRRRGRLLILCLVVGLMGAVVPARLGQLVDTFLLPGGGAQISEVGGLVGRVLGPVALVVALIVTLLRELRTAPPRSP